MTTAPGRSGRVPGAADSAACPKHDSQEAIHDLDEGDRPNRVNAIQPVISNQDQALQDLAAQAG